MSVSSLEWDGTAPPPSPASECVHPLLNQRGGGGGYGRLRVRGWGSSNSDDWRVPECLSLRRNWVLPHPLPRKRACLPPWTQRGEEQHSPVEEGV